MEVADQRHLDAVLVAQAVADLGHLRGRGAVVDRDAHDLRAGLRQLGHLRAVARASAVSVLVIDCTTTGPSGPIGTGPTMQVRLGRRAALIGTRLSG